MQTLHTQISLRRRNVALLLSLVFVLTAYRSTAATPEPPPAASLADATGYSFLPFITRPQILVPTVHVPYFAGDIIFSQTAIFWFGTVNRTENYVDVRVGYNNQELYVYAVAFDRRLWFDTVPSASDLTSWDSVTLYLDRSGSGGGAPGLESYRFDAQLNGQEDDGRYERSARGDGAGWIVQSVPFYSMPGWRGTNLNNNVGDDLGWGMLYRISFTSLGLAGPPPQGSQWRLALALHDRDDAGGTAIADKIWPASMSGDSPDTWGRLSFGLPEYTPLSVTPAGTTTIRNRLNGAVVEDAAVGGHTLCGDGLNIWTQWGDATESVLNPLHTQVNVMNQGDVADWPCFSKYYITFPLNAIPAGKAILSASLTLSQFGNAGASGEAERSLIQVLTVNQDWDAATLTWNNAPLAWENVSQAWVDPLLSYPGDLGVPRTWDLSYAVAWAYSRGGALRLALYSADYARHSGKYFLSSDIDDWLAVARPTLDVTWGNP